MNTDEELYDLDSLLSLSHQPRTLVSGSVVNRLSAIKLIDRARCFLIIYGYEAQEQNGLIFRTRMDVYPGGELFGPHRLEFSKLVLADV